ncbi:MAG: hypothetical protein GEV11_23675 [Streptosporangiales bacterium]|nr:hypothetical protein [Streptosporangiales bacterium]
MRPFKAFAGIGFLALATPALSLVPTESAATRPPAAHRAATAPHIGTVPRATGTVPHAASTTPHATGTAQHAASTTLHADVTGDGRADLVMQSGYSARVRTGADRGGSLYVVPGAPVQELPGGPAALLSQDAPGVPGTSEDGDTWGAALAAGDFDGDGRDDVAVGNPYEDLGRTADAGTVTVLYGTPRAPYLEPRGQAAITQDTAGVPGTAEAGDRFGAALAAGDFDGDGHDDLAIGAYAEALGREPQAGTTTVLRGSPGGLTTTQALGLHQDVPGVAGTVERYDRFGMALAAGDVTGDGRDDLAVGAPTDAVARLDAWGLVHLFPGSENGPATSGDTAVPSDGAGTQGAFGYALTIGRFAGGPYGDVVAAAAQRRGAPAYSGAVVRLAGGSGGLTGRVSRIDQETTGVPGGSETDDVFGDTLAAGDVDGDGRDDLLVGALGENLTGERSGAGTGAAWLLYGAAARPLGGPVLGITENTLDAEPRGGEYFGADVALLDVDGDGSPEPVILADGEHVEGDATGAAFALDPRRTGDTVSTGTSHRLTRNGLGAVSAYGPGFPIAGGASTGLYTEPAATIPQRAPDAPRGKAPRLPHPQH